MDPIRNFQNYAVPFQIVTGTSHDVKGVVNSLSKKELHFICPESKHWVESPFKDLRYIAKAENGDVMGFVDGYCFPDDLDTVVLVIAVKKQYRGHWSRRSVATEGRRLLSAIPQEDLLPHRQGQRRIGDVLQSVPSETDSNHRRPVRLRDDRCLENHLSDHNLLKTRHRSSQPDRTGRPASAVILGRIR